MEGPRAHPEREFETGMDEVFKLTANMIAANIKRTYDEYQDLGINAARTIQNLTVQTLQSAISLATRMANNGAFADHLATLQAIAHRDVAIDSTWVPGPGEEGIEMPADKDE